MIWTPMPETTVDKNGNAVPRQHEIGRRPIGDRAVHPKSETMAMNRASQRHLRPCVSDAARSKVRPLAGADPLTITTHPVAHPMA
jgi:hypothetical protein